MPDGSDARLVGFREGVRRAAHRPVHPQRAQRRPRQGGLARAESAGEPDDDGGARAGGGARGPRPQDRFESAPEGPPRPLRRGGVRHPERAAGRRPDFAHRRHGARPRGAASRTRAPDPRAGSGADGASWRAAALQRRIRASTHRDPASPRAACRGAAPFAGTRAPDIRAGPPAAGARRPRRPRASRALRPGPPRRPPPRAGTRRWTRRRPRCIPGRAAPRRRR